MLFSSIPFLYYFIPTVLLVYFIMPQKGKNAVLMLFSLLFYAWGEKQLVFLFAGSILFGWLIGLGLEQIQSPYARKGLLAAAVAVDIGMLGYFKYADFFLENLNRLFGSDLPLLQIALPIGISFYLFQLMSYDIDVYRRSVPAQKNPIDFAAYVAMFPQLIAGPIVRYSDIRTDLKNRQHTMLAAAEGIRRFSIGLTKKVVLANVLGELCVQFRAAEAPSVLYFWLYAVAFTLQIYFDFSGYSDMAIGLGRVFGFRFPENFRYPYISASITEFWRRWHISLGSWFRDYVYIPLGGNRCGTGRQLLHIFIVWMLTGFWHGADWNFILWGLFYAVLLTLEKLGLGKYLERHRGLGHGYVILCVILGFVLFNANSLTQAAGDIAGMVSFGRIPFINAETLYCLRSYAVTLILAVIGTTPIPKMIWNRLRNARRCGRICAAAETILPAAGLLVSTAFLVDGSFNPFLYFRF